jgi:hypothetical protein
MAIGSPVKSTRMRLWSAGGTGISVQVVTGKVIGILMIGKCTSLPFFALTCTGRVGSMRDVGPGVVPLTGAGQLTNAQRNMRGAVNQGHAIRAVITKKKLITCRTKLGVWIQLIAPVFGAKLLHFHGRENGVSTRIRDGGCF